jgi:hypothetical protein
LAEGVGGTHCEIDCSHNEVADTPCSSRPGLC